eukprot:365725-Chlamydomonas_euryale.AAC.1
MTTPAACIREPCLPNVPYKLPSKLPYKRPYKLPSKLPYKRRYKPASPPQRTTQLPATARWRSRWSRICNESRNWQTSLSGSACGRWPLQPEAEQTHYSRSACWMSCRHTCLKRSASPRRRAAAATCPRTRCWTIQECGGYESRSGGEVLCKESG